MCQILPRSNRRPGHPATLPARSLAHPSACSLNANPHVDWCCVHSRTCLARRSLPADVLDAAAETRSVGPCECGAAHPAGCRWTARLPFLVGAKQIARALNAMPTGKRMPVQKISRDLRSGAMRRSCRARWPGRSAPARGRQLISRWQNSCSLDRRKCSRRRRSRLRVRLDIVRQLRPASRHDLFMV